MRKSVGDTLPSATSEPSRADIDVRAVAHVHVTSEDPAHPIDDAFDGTSGPGASAWVARAEGEQAITVAFDAPQRIGAVRVEIEETQVPRTQQLELALSNDGGRTFDTAVRQEFSFSPEGARFERERWTVARDGVTHVKLVIRPDKQSPARGRARLTTLAFEERRFS